MTHAEHATPERDAPESLPRYLARITPRYVEAPRFGHYKRQERPTAGARPETHYAADADGLGHLRIFGNGRWTG